MAAKACELALRTVDPLIRSGQKVVLYVAVGGRARGLVPFTHIADGSAPAHVALTILFNEEYIGTDITLVWNDESSAVLDANAPLPVDDTKLYAPTGPMGKLLQRVVTDGLGAVVVLFAGTNRLGNAPPLFRYMHFIEAVYAEMIENNWSTVMDGRNGAFVRALLLFSDDLQLGEYDAAEMVGFHLVFPSAQCDRTYARSTAELALSDEFGRLWFYAGCGYDANDSCAIARGAVPGAAHRTTRKELERRVAVLRAALARDEAALAKTHKASAAAEPKPEPAPQPEPAAEPKPEPASQPEPEPEPTNELKRRGTPGLAAFTPRSRPRPPLPTQ